MTRRGYVGVVPPGASTDDIVSVFRGTQTPFVLLPASEGVDAEMGSGSGGAYHLVGEAYVHGMMDGEAFRGRPPLENVVIV